MSPITAPIDRAYIEILPDLRRFAPQMKAQVTKSMTGLSTGVGNEYRKTTGIVQTETDKMTKATKSVADQSKRSITSIGAAAGAVAGLAVGSLVKSFVTAADEQRKANAQTAAVIKSTGSAAHVTADQIGELSGKLAEQSGIQDDVIQGGANLLLTFTNIRNEAGKGNDVFNQSVAVITDMSVALGQDMKSSAIQVGKALNDPIKGITALTRVGVTFSEAQKKQIQVMVQTGDTLGAQKVILNELNKEFGGSAAAQATAADKMKVSWDNFSESIGNALLPALDTTFSIFKQILDLLGPSAPIIVGVGIAFGVLATAVWAGVKAYVAWNLVTTNVGKALGWLRVQTLGLATANGIMATSTRGALVGLLALSAPVLGTAAGAAALAVGAIALEKALGGASDKAQKMALSGIGDLDKALSDSKGVFDRHAQSVLTDTLVNAGFAEKAKLAGISAGELTAGVTGSDEAFKGLIERWKASGDPSDQTIGNLQRLHDHFKEDTKATDENSAAKDKNAAVQHDVIGATQGVSAALIEQKTFLLDNNLTVEQATKKYNDAVREATSLTAQLGYMSEALNQLSNNNINATLQQDQLNLTMGTAADNFKGARDQVAQHGHALEGNTADAISNRAWALNQIQAINQQAITFATSTGKVSEGTRVMGINTGALRESMKQAGFTDQQIKTLIDRYATTPQAIETLVKQKGQDAIVAKLGEMTDMLRRIADPAGWTAQVNLKFQQLNTSMPLAAKGGLIGGSGGPRADDKLILASTGEFIVNAADTAKNLPYLTAINNGAQKLAAGGLVGVPGLGNRFGPLIGNLRGSTFGNSRAAALAAQQFFTFLGAETFPDTAEYDRRLTAMAQAVADKMTPSSLPIPGGGTVSANVAAEQAYALSLFRYYNWPSSELSSLISLWNGESGWNPGALNPSSGAYGIPQSLPASKMASAGADWATNAATQIRWGVNYINSVYGSPSAAWGAWLSRSPHWYGDGLAPTLFRRPTLLGVGDRGPETVSVTPGDGRGGEPLTVELSPATIRALAVELAKLSITLDGREVASVVAEHQRQVAIRGPRR